MTYSRLRDEAAPSQLPLLIEATLLNTPHPSIHACIDAPPQAFGAGALPGLGDNPAVQQLEERYAAAIRREVAGKLREALALKERAALESRLSRQARASALLQARIRALQGLSASYPTETPQQL